jgi:glycosyltransferase involved in cell wall biosynthesis
VHIMKMCSAMAALNHTVVLLVPHYKTNIEKGVDDVYRFYNVEKNFEIMPFSIPAMRGWKYVFAYKLARWIKKHPADVLYSRTLYCAAMVSFFGLPVASEFHRPPSYEKGIWKRLVKKYYKSANLTKVVVISEALKKLFLNAGFAEQKVLVAHDAANLPETTGKVALGPGLHVGYTGHLYTGKGMEVIEAVAPLMKEVNFHVVGGTEVDIAKWKDRITSSNVIFHGFKPQNEISLYINAFDICLLPNQRKIGVWGNDNVNISDVTSPLKMFEYMAHKKPVIASDLPVLKEVLNETNAMLCNPDVPQEWVNAIRFLQENADFRAAIANKAFADFAASHSWYKRAEFILASLQ